MRGLLRLLLLPAAVLGVAVELLAFLVAVRVGGAPFILVP